MNSNVNAVAQYAFGTKQEAIISPKDGYELEKVTVLNSTTNEEVEVELKKNPNNPAQWICSFLQPAGTVTIKPVLKPIFYSVIIEECENCDIILVEQDAAAEIQIRAAENTTPTEEVSSENEEINIEKEDNSEAQSENSNFSDPQHSFKTDTGTASVLDVEETDSKDSTEKNAQNTDNDGDEIDDELKDIEPTYITQAANDKKHRIFWDHRTAFEEGRITKAKFEEVKKKHMQYLDDVSSGRIIIKE